MRTTLRITCAVVTLIACTLQISAAQVSITSSDILGLIGTSQRIASDTTGSVSVTVGAPGENQTWDLSGIVLQAATFDRAFLTPAQTPFAAEFPTANFVSRGTSPDFQGAAAFQFNDVQANGITELGAAVDFGDSSWVFVEPTPETIALPVNFNDSWIDMERDTVGEISSFAIISDDSTFNLVDGWGTVIVPGGTFSALRVRGNVTETTEQWVGGTLFSTSTSTYIEYEWVSPDGFVVASFGSQENETNPNFSNAEEAEMLEATTTAVDPGLDGPTVPLAIESTYPNPFADRVAIEYVATGGPAEIVVFDVLGRRVRTLQENSPGGAFRRIAVWDGRTDSGRAVANGIYLVRLGTSDSSVTRKVVLVRN